MFLFPIYEFWGWGWVPMSSGNWVVRSRRQLHDIKNWVKVTHRRGRTRR